MIERDTVDHFATVSEHNRTPSRKESIVSFGSEQPSNLGDVED